LYSQVAHGDRGHRSQARVKIEPMQLAALLLERMTAELSAADAEELLDRKRAG
jgi:hypothetical protein